MDAFYYWLGFVIFWFWVGTVCVLTLLSFIPAPSERRAAKIDQGVA